MTKWAFYLAMLIEVERTPISLSGSVPSNPFQRNFAQIRSKTENFQNETSREIPSLYGNTFLCHTSKFTLRWFIPLPYPQMFLDFVVNCLFCSPCFQAHFGAKSWITQARNRISRFFEVAMFYWALSSAVALFRSVFGWRASKWFFRPSWPNQHLDHLGCLS